MMAVLQLGPYPPPHGGVQTNLVAIRRYLMERGIPCPVINLTRYRQPDHDGVYFPAGAVEVLRLLLRLQFTVAHLHVGGNLSARLLLLGFACHLLPGVKTVLTLHSGGYPGSAAGRAARRWSWRGFVLRRFDRVIAVNEELKGLFERKFGLSHNRVRLIPPHSFPEGLAADRLPPRIEDFFRQHDPVLLSMGWLAPEYDYPTQIQALIQVREQYPRAGLAVLGQGALEEALREQIQAVGCEEDVLLAGDIPHAAALTAIAQCGVFLRTTLYDGDSISVREALHLGVPVIATDNGMRPPGVILIPVSDPAALAAAITRQLSSGRPESKPPLPADENIQAVYELYREISG